MKNIRYYQIEGKVRNEIKEKLGGLWPVMFDQDCRCAYEDGYKACIKDFRLEKAKTRNRLFLKINYKRNNKADIAEILTLEHNKIVLMDEFHKAIINLEKNLD